MLDVLALLPDEDRTRVQAMTPKLRETFGSAASTWQGVLDDALELPPTFPEDVRTQWVDLSAAAAAAGQVLSPDDYAAVIADSFDG
ncbi:hypothetical protein DSM112329_02810 [Paraconexibacter sp. AEG42_29]|uniref:Uncharacterized protein n=1 Tax=Paraconexibacter sp. AEG42_29 TaxID=2997339 RepID=A0AAU7AWD4_9ACTN